MAPKMTNLWSWLKKAVFGLCYYHCHDVPFVLQTHLVTTEFRKNRMAGEPSGTSLLSMPAFEEETEDVKPQISPSINSQKSKSKRKGKAKSETSKQKTSSPSKKIKSETVEQKTVSSSSSPKSKAKAKKKETAKTKKEVKKKSDGDSVGVVSPPNKKKRSKSDLEVVEDDRVIVPKEEILSDAETSPKGETSKSAKGLCLWCKITYRHDFLQSTYICFKFGSKILHGVQSLTKVLVTWWSFRLAQYKLLPVWIFFWWTELFWQFHIINNLLRVGRKGTC